MKTFKQKTRTYFAAIILTLGGIFAAVPAFATHIIGGEISYQYLGNDTFFIKLDVYRDCYSGIPGFDAPAHIAIFDDAGFPIQGIPASILNPQVSYSDTIPNNIAGDPCLFVPGTVCVEHARYQFKVKLTGPGGFHVVYQRCCRNESIVNIVNPLDAGATYSVYISPLAKSLSNSSPSFGFYPPVFVCINKPILQPHAATDINGDSLVYKFYTPYLGASQAYPNPHVGSPPYDPSEIMPPPFTPVTFDNPPYNLGQLLGPSTNTLSINPQTGLITGLPKIQGQFVVGVLVEEYRNGQLLSVVRRDFQYNVGECAEIVSNIIAPSAQCDNMTVKFKTNTQVATNWAWYFNWPNLTPTSNQKEPTYTFPGPGTYTVALIAEPGTTCADTSFHQILLQNNSLTPNFSWQTYDCTNQSVLVLTDLSTDNVSPVNQWFWTVTYGGTTQTSTLQNPVFQIPNPSSGTIKLTVNSVNGCVQTKTVNFVSGNNNPISVLPGTVQACIGSPVPLNPNGISTGFTYQWGPNVPSNQRTLVNPIVSPLQTTVYNVTITGFGGLCQSTGSVTVAVNALPVLNFQSQTDCNAKIVHFTNQSQNSPAGYLWNFGDPSTLLDVSTQANPTYTYANYGTYTVTLMTAPTAVCKDTITKQITIAEKVLTADFDYDYTNCGEDAVTIHFTDKTVNSLGNTATWLWQFSGIYNGTSTVPNPTITVTQQGNLIVKLTITTAEGCTNATANQALNIDFTELPGLADNDVLGCLFGGVTLNPGGNPNYIYHWTPATGLSCTDCPSPFANPSQTTTYTVQVLNLSADTCDLTKQVKVNVPLNVGLVASNDVTTCNQTATLTATTSLLPVTYAWFLNAAQVGTGSSLPVTVSGYKDYVVRATDQFGCPYYDTVSVVGGPPNIATTGDITKCTDEQIGVTGDNLDLNDTLVWQWSPASAFNGPTNVEDPTLIVVPGHQEVYAQATNQFGCVTTDTVDVVIVDENFQLDFDYVVQCNGTQVQFINQSTDAFDFSWNFGDLSTLNDVSLLDNPIYTYPGLGTYNVMLTINYDVACTDTIFLPVEIVDVQFVTDFTFEYQDCDVDFIDVQFHDATTFLVPNVNVTSWFWQLSTGATSTDPNPVFTLQAGQEYEVTMTISTSNGCLGSVEKSLKLDFLQVNLVDTLVLCQGDSAFINPTGNTGYVYSWSPNIAISDINSPNPSVYPTTTTTYTVEIINFSPDTCSVTREVTVFVPERIDVTADNDTLTCGTPVTLHAFSNVPATTYQWTANPGGFVGNGPVLSILPSVDTQYKVVGTDQYGCRDSSNINVANETVQALMASISPECPDKQVLLTTANNVADHVLSYVWTATPPGQILPPGNGATVTALTAPAGQSATYAVTLTNQFGCTQSLSQTISSYNFVPTVLPDVMVCPGVAEPINPGANPSLTYQWFPGTGLSPSPNVPNPNVTVLQSTTYNVTVSNSFGNEACQEVLQVQVDAAPIIQITETVDTFTCGQPINIGATVNVPVTLVWQDAAGNPLGTGNMLSVDPILSATYTVIATDTFGCDAEDQVFVSNNQVDIVLDGKGVIDTCPADQFNLCVTNIDINDVLMFEWSGNQIISGGDQACATVTTAQGVTTPFTVLATNQWGCFQMDTIFVTTHVFDPIVRDEISICPGVATPINPDAEGLTGLIYEWSPASVLDDPTSPNPSATLYNDTLFTVLVKGYNEDDTCSYLQTVQVNVMPLINLLTQPSDTSICEPVDVLVNTLTTSNVIESYVWSQSLDFNNPISTASQVTVTPTASQTYYVMATDTLGCRDTAQVTLHAYPVSISLDDDFNFCKENAPLTITVTNNEPGQILAYDWTPLDGISEVEEGGRIIRVDINDTTVFVLNVENQFGCKATDSTVVYFYDIFPTVGEISSSEDTIIFNSGQFSQLEINFDPTYIYQWTPEDGLDDATIFNPQAMPDETTLYTVLVTNEGGCFLEKSVEIVVINPDCDEPNIFVPNAFTPNGDGENDVMFVRANILESFEFAIYNRWGQKVFETTDQSMGWDGTFKNELQPPDMFGFYLKAKCFNGQEFFKKGNITLLR